MEEARFIERPNRFTVRCALGSEILDAYLPNPGRLWELLLPDSVLYVVRRDVGQDRKLRGVVVAVEREGRPVMLHTLACNDIVADLLRQKRLPGFEGMNILQREIARGRSRFDFLLEQNGAPLLLESSPVPSSAVASLCFPMRSPSADGGIFWNWPSCPDRGHPPMSSFSCTGLMRTSSFRITTLTLTSLRPFWPCGTRSGFLPWRSTGSPI